MPNESAGGPTLPPPSDALADFERFREAIGAAPPAVRALLERPGAADSLREYGRLLHAKSADLALIAKGDRSQIFTRHVLDSLNPLSLFPQPPESALDVGSGGGLPGIPLAIAWPDTRVVLLESRERKAGFLELAVRSLALRNVHVVCARLEDAKRASGGGWTVGSCDAVFVRALAGLDEVLDGVAPACRPGARWVYFLGARAPEEVTSNGRHTRGAEVVSGAFGGRLLTGRLAKG